jgi:hypothetical protein
MVMERVGLTAEFLGNSVIVATQMQQFDSWVPDRFACFFFLFAISKLKIFTQSRGKLEGSAPNSTRRRWFGGADLGTRWEGFSLPLLWWQREKPTPKGEFLYQLSMPSTRDFCIVEETSFIVPSSAVQILFIKSTKNSIWDPVVCIQTLLYRIVYW